METIIDRTITPSTKEIESIEIAKAKKQTLDNGIPVYSIAAGFQDLVKIEFIFFNREFNHQRPLLNSATNRMLGDGTSKYTAQQLADRIDYFGSFYETDENADFTSVMLYSLNKHLSSTIPFIKEILTDAVFPEKELQTFITNNRQRLIVENEKVGSLVRRKFNQVIFGDEHPYGYMTQPTDYEKLGRQQLADHFKEKYKASNYTILISGMVNDDAIKLLNQHFGKMPIEGTSAPQKNNSFNSSAEKNHFIEKEGAVQSALRIGKPFFNRTHADYPGMAVLNTVLGGYFGSRLMSNIREDKGYTYGIGSAIVSMRQEGYFFISTEVGADVTNAAIKEIHHEIDVLKKELVGSEELSMVRNYMLGTFLKGMDGAFQLAERFKSIYFSGLDYSYYDRYLQKVRSIQPEELRELARKYLDDSGFFEVIVGRK